MTHVSIEIPGQPVAKQRARTVNGHTYTPPKTRAYEEKVAIIARASRVKFAEGDLSVTIRLCSTKLLRGDIDNYAKSVLDGLVKGGVIGDDKQIASLLVDRVRTEKENAVLVTVSEL